MNTPEKLAFLADIQAQVDDRDLCIDADGIKRGSPPDHDSGGSEAAADDRDLVDDGGAAR